jgi:hypothetical protein
VVFSRAHCSPHFFCRGCARHTFWNHVTSLWRATPPVNLTIKGPYSGSRVKRFDLFWTLRCTCETGKLCMHQYWIGTSTQILFNFLCTFAHESCFQVRNALFFGHHETILRRVWLSLPLSKSGALLFLCQTVVFAHSPFVIHAH